MSSIRSSRLALPRMKKRKREIKARWKERSVGGRKEGNEGERDGGKEGEKGKPLCFY